MIGRGGTLFVVSLLALPGVAGACEPAVPLAMILSGGLFVLPIAALVLGAIALKAATFAFLERRRLAWPQALLFMFAANAFSTIIGFLLALGPAAPFLFLFSLLVDYVISLQPSARILSAYPGALGRTTSPSLALWITVAYLVTVFLFGYSQSFLFEREIPWTYWAYKLAWVFLALSISIFLTTAWEEWVVALMAKRPEGNFFPTVLRANLVTLFALMLAAAVVMLPQRMQSKVFLVLRDAASALLAVAAP